MICARHFLLLLFILGVNTGKNYAQTLISLADTAYYHQQIVELENELELKGIGNSRVYNLAAYHSLLGETDVSIAYLQMAVENGLLILAAIADDDLENARSSKEWPAIRKRIIGNWYKYYPFGDADYALELIKMKMNYLRQRQLITRIQKEYDDRAEEYWEAVDEAKKLAKENGEELDSLITVHGWPRQNFVGQAQTRAAALVLVYSTGELQKKYLSEIEKAVEYGEIEGRYQAIITDKILVAEDKKQLYGTNYTYNDSIKGYEIAPIDNEIEVDKRRIKLGLDSLNIFLKGLNVVDD